MREQPRTCSLRSFVGPAGRTGVRVDHAAECARACARSKYPACGGCGNVAFETHTDVCPACGSIPTGWSPAPVSPLVPVLGAYVSANCSPGDAAALLYALAGA